MTKTNDTLCAAGGLKNRSERQKQRLALRCGRVEKPLRTTKATARFARRAGLKPAPNDKSNGSLCVAGGVETRSKRGFWVFVVSSLYV
jgi:hypothetical protein